MSFSLLEFLVSLKISRNKNKKDENSESQGIENILFTAKRFWVFKSLKISSKFLKFLEK